MTSTEKHLEETRGVPSSRLPEVTMLWLNYNSMKNLPLILESIESMLMQTFPNYEVIIIDNASSDGSYEAIRQHLERRSSLAKERPPLIRFVRTPVNLGYTGGFDYGYGSKASSSRYVAVVSDDAILSRGYLEILVNELDKNPAIGAVQGIVATLDGKRIDSAGVFVDKLMIPHHVNRGKSVEGTAVVRKVSFVEGTCPVYRVEALDRILGGHLFYPSGFFLYLEDNLNGLLLWNNGYACITVPTVIARHKREAGGGGLLRTYCLWRNRTALVRLTDSRYKPLEYLFGMASMLYLLLSGQKGKARMLIKGVTDGRRLSSRMRQEYGFKISLEPVPTYRLGLDYITGLLSKSRGRGRLDEMDL